MYASVFDKGAGEGWSKKQVTKCPSGRRTFLGPFSYESTALSLDDLPEHARVQLSFDLLIIQTWDGDSDLDQPTATGPDLFDVTVDRGQRLVHASFAWPSADRNTQSFPGRFPYDHLPAATAATQTGTLGYTWPGQCGPMDWTYHIERSFAHSGRQLKIAFSGINLQGVNDESWGIDNVRVEVLQAAKARTLDKDAFAKLWTDLGSADPKAFVPAVDAMIDLGEPCAAAIRQRLARPAESANRDKRLDKLIANLDADDYMVREHAMRELRAVGTAAEPALPGADNTMSLEVRTRVDKLLLGLKRYEIDNEEGRRLRRTVEVLELVGGEQARSVLAGIAGRTGTLASWEAKGALQRLDGKADIPTKLDLPPGLAKSGPRPN